jgi:hypothetical protein
MKLSGFVFTILAIAASAGSADGVRAQQKASAAPPADAAMTVAAVVGCVAAEGQLWVLTDASQPIVVPATDGKSTTGSGVTLDRAKQEPIGKEKYRLMNMLTEFGVPEHKGQRVLVKGLVVGSRNERRINLVSLEPVSPSCR